MTAIRLTPLVKPEPLERVREAMDWAAVRGFTVDVGGEHGIRSAVLMGERRWIRARAGGYVSPLGAVVLRDQPRADVMPEAAAEAMEVSVPWVQGFEAGSAKQAPDVKMVRGFSAAAYLAGFEVGVQVRMHLLSAHCAAHGTTYSRIGGSCGLCEVEADHAAELARDAADARRRS